MEDNNIIIRFAELNDFDRIMYFIKSNWNENHILAKNKQLMKYEHVFNKEFRYVLAEDSLSKNIYGICGFIKSNSSDKSDLWTVVWKTIKSPNVMLGIDILKFIKEKTNCRIIASCGINPNTVSIYEFLNYTTGRLNHYYRLADKNKYNVAIINEKKILPVLESKLKLKTINSFHELSSIFYLNKYEERKPYKDFEYIKHRYFEHLKYKYKIYGIDNGKDVIDSILIGREIVQNEVKVFRIVDFIGLDEDLVHVSNSMQELIEDNCYEYIDFYCHGIDHNIMTKAGFTLKDGSDNNVIPNYFEPFEQKNVDINYFTNDNEEFYMFKADGDQDRPNIL